MLKAVFSGGIEEITVTGLTQWDTGQKLEITLADLPNKFEVHFAQYRRSEIAYVVEATSNNGVATVSIPNLILQVASKSACAWIYIPSDDGHETVKTINLPIQERARPADYVYEEEEILYFEKVMERTESAAQRAEEAQAKAEELAVECKVAQDNIAVFEEYNRNNYSNSLKANASGEVVRVDDVSPAQHNVKVKITGIDDPSSVKVTRCGKNLLNPIGTSNTLKGVTFTNNGDGSFSVKGTSEGAVSFALTDLAKAQIYLCKGKTYTQSISVLKGTKDDSCAVVPAVKDVDGNITWNYFDDNQTKTADKNYTFYAYTLYVNGGVTVDFTFTVQLETGGIGTDFEAYKEATTHTPNADGTVDGILSLAPTMTVFTDTPGANIEIEYNQDINVVANDIDSALDAIIAIQNALIGGEA